MQDARTMDRPRIKSFSQGIEHLVINLNSMHPYYMRKSLIKTQNSSGNSDYYVPDIFIGRKTLKTMLLLTFALTYLLSSLQKRHMFLYTT
jgi:hypothetical protein